MSSIKCFVVAIAGIMSLASTMAQSPTAEAQVRQTVQAFYAAFNLHSFDRATDFTTEDWNHINPLGGRTNGRTEVLKELGEVHSTFLKGVTDNIERMDVRFASPDTAVATVVSRVSTFTSPDGVKHENERQIRTFVVVKRDTRWLVMQDHNTIVMAPRG